MPAPDLFFDLLKVICSYFIAPPLKQIEYDRPRGRPQTGSGSSSHMSSYSSKLAQYKAVYQDTKTRLETAEREKQEAKRDKAEALHQFSRLQQVYDRVYDQRQSLAKEVKRVKGELAQLRLDQELERQQAQNETLANSAKVADSVIEGKWKALDYSIRSLSYTLSKAAPEGEFDQETVPRLRFVTPEFEALLQDNDYREFVIQGYLWYLIDTEIFAGEGHIWANSTGFHFKKTRRAMINQAKISKSSEELQQIMRWFVTGSALMEDLWGIDEEALNRLVDLELGYLQPFIQGQSMDPESLTKTVKSQLSDILRSSLELDEVIMRSKAILTATWTKNSRPNSGPYKYDPDIMDPVAFENDLTKSSVVRFPVSPVLAKTGNANGSDYNRRIILAKGSVVCD